MITKGASVKLANVSMTFGHRQQAKEVVHDCMLEIEPGKLSVMIGPSGCGKSTLARLIAGFEKPTAGSVTCDGAPVTGPSKERLMLFQETALYPWMTTLGNVLYGPLARGEPSGDSLRSAQSIIHRVGLHAFQGKFPAQLSGGMQRRVELARALINSPRLMILDEPFRGLDAMTKALMQEYFSALFQETHSTVLFVTTDIDEAIFLADKLIIMKNVPTRVRKIIDIRIPRPRKLADVFESDVANEVKMEALSLLHEEAMRSFKVGGKASSDFVDAYAKRIGRTARKAN